eukprot:6162980-Pyramimonas_sp.AAC.5
MVAYGRPLNFALNASPGGHLCETGGRPADAHPAGGSGPRTAESHRGTAGAAPETGRTACPRGEA